MKIEEPTYIIMDHICVLAVRKNEWRKEVNVVAWNGGEPKYDIREWSPDHARMSRGITLTAEEMKAVIDGIGGDPVVAMQNTIAVSDTKGGDDK